MYQESTIKGIATLDSSEIYFILKWGEIFHKVPLNYRTIIPLCSRSILKESIEVLKLASLGILKEYNVTNILETLIESIKSDEILRPRFKRDYDHLLNELSIFDSNVKAQKDEKGAESVERKNIGRERQRKTLLLLCESLLNKMESTNILKIYNEFLKTNVFKAKYGQIDRYVELLAGELLHEGHSKQYLFGWGEENLVFNSKSFSDRLDNLLKIGKKEIKQYECIFELCIDRIHLTFPPLYKSEGNVVFVESRKMELNRLKDLIKQGDVIGVGDFFTRDGQLARVTVKAVDIYSAVDEAKRRLISITKIFNLHPKFTRFDPSIGEYLVIYTEHDKKITYFHDKAKQDVLTLGESIKLFEIKTTTLTEESYKGLDQLLQWCRVVQESPKETSIVAMWSMLEFLFASEQKDKFGAVLKYSKAYIAHYYAKSLLNRTNKLLRKDSTSYNNLKNALNTYKPNSLTTAGNIKLECLFEYVTENESLVQSIYQKDTIGKRYISLIKMLTTIKSSKGKEPKRVWLLHFLEQVEMQVISDLQRAYRVRNILAHQALSEGDHLDDIYNKLIFYVQIILNNVIYSMKKQPYNTIQQLNELKFITYENYRRGIDRHLSSPFNFEELISNDILYLD